MAKSASRIGILGGTFDPVHNGHLALAKAALEQLNLDRVFMVLSPLSPFKIDDPPTPVPERLAMLSLAIEGEKNISIGDWELRRRGPSYTVTTLADYKTKNLSHELFLILGSDALATFDDWKDPVKIMKMATLVVGRRPGTPLRLSNLEGRMFFLRGVFPPVSSSGIRRDIAKGRKPKGLGPPVMQFIKTNQLYER